MTTDSSEPQAATPRPKLSRRRFLGVTASVGAVAAAAPFAVQKITASSATRPDDPQSGIATGPAEQADDGAAPSGPAAPTGSGQILVVVHLDGGNDGLNTVVPMEDPLYHQLRGDGAAPIENVYPLDSSFGLASMPYLAERWAAEELALVHGVGIVDGSLSHFAATDIWEGGSLDPGVFSGWLGRAVEHRYGADADPLLGVCAGSFSRSLVGETWTPFTLPTSGALPWSSEFVAQNPSLVEGLHQLQTSELPGLAGDVVTGHELLRSVGERIDGARPEGDAGQDRRRGIFNDLAVVADVINADLGTRVFHVRHGGFDTHANQLASHPGLLTQLDDALAAFHARLGANRDRVVVMTWTEFGRRVAFNGSGTDHGTSSIGMVLGPSVAGGHYGEPIDLGTLDRAGNPLVTTDFRNYAAGVCAQVLDLPADAISDVDRPVEVLAT